MSAWRGIKELTLLSLTHTHILSNKKWAALYPNTTFPALLLLFIFFFRLFFFFYLVKTKNLLKRFTGKCSKLNWMYTRIYVWFSFCWYILHTRLVCWRRPCILPLAAFSLIVINLFHKWLLRVNIRCVYRRIRIYYDVACSFIAVRVLPLLSVHISAHILFLMS